MNKLNILVSSTCYDLSQIRADLYSSISNLGYAPILSEFPSFPINPTNNTLENCIEAVNSSADIFILIIGTRYGFRLESGKSITNMEFLTAQNKGIPIYVFISKQIINLMPVYLNNKMADYSSVVDNSEIFEFANDVKNNSGLWCFEFEKFQDIDNILKTQLSYLFKESLLLRNKFHINKDYDFYLKLSKKSLKIILLKETAFEFEFLAQALIDEISNYELLRKDYEHKIILNVEKKIDSNLDFVKWIQERLAGTLAYMPTLKNVINDLIPKYLNEPGKPSDIEGLYYVANAYARIYKSFVTWSINTLSVAVEDDQIEVRNALSDLTSNAIKIIWDFPFEFLKNIQDAKRRVQGGESTITIKMDLVVEIEHIIWEKYNQAFEKYKRSIH